MVFVPLIHIHVLLFCSFSYSCFFQYIFQTIAFRSNCCFFHPHFLLSNNIYSLFFFFSSFFPGFLIFSFLIFLLLIFFCFEFLQSFFSQLQNLRTLSPTQMYTGNSEKAHPLVGCEGSYEQNQNRLLWAENGAGLGISFKNQHLGMGVFVRSRDDVAPIPILIRVNDLYHSQIQVVFSEPVEDSNKWVEPNPNDFRVRMGALEWINVTRYIKINATFMINGTITVTEKDNINTGNERKVNRSNLTFTHQEWYDINMNGQIWDGIYVKDVVLSNVTTLEQQRPNVADIVSASLTSDGNLTLSVSIQSEGAAREWSTVVIVLVIFIS